MCNASEVDGTDGCLIECPEGEIVNIDLPAGEWSCGEDDGRCPGSLALGCDGDATTSTVPPPDTDCEEVCRGAAEGQQVGLLVIFAYYLVSIILDTRELLQPRLLRVLCAGQLPRGLPRPHAVLPQHRGLCQGGQVRGPRGHLLQWGTMMG